MDSKISKIFRISLFFFLILTYNYCGLQEMESIDVIQPFPVESVKLISKGSWSYRFDLKVKTTSPCWRFYKEDVNRVTDKVYVKIFLHNRGEACPPENGLINVPIILAFNYSLNTATLKFWRSDTSTLDTTIILRK